MYKQLLVFSTMAIPYQPVQGATGCPLHSGVSRKKPDRLAVDVGNRIAQIRKTRGWSQEDLGKRYGASQKRISEIERGDRELRLGTLRKVADALGVAPYVLLLPDPKKPPTRPQIGNRAILGYLERCDANSRDFLRRVVASFAEYLADSK